MRAGTCGGCRPRAVGADGEPLVGKYDSSHGTPQAGARRATCPAPLRLRQRRGPRWGCALLVMLAAAAGLVTYHLVAPGPAGRAPAAAPAAQRAVGVHKAARTAAGTTNTPAPPAARPGSREVVISLAALNEACWPT